MSKRAAYNNTEPEQQHAVHTTEEGSCSGAFEAHTSGAARACGALWSYSSPPIASKLRAPTAARTAYIPRAPANAYTTENVGEEHTEPNNTETSVV